MSLKSKILTASLFASLFPSAISAAQLPHPAPSFSAKNQDGKVVSLSDFKGKPVLVYFYPKDDTPGCTKEACLLRDYYSQFEKAGASILGVSRQDAKSHQEFRKKHRLPFDLLVDEDGSLAKAFGVGLYPVVGFHKRQSVLIDRGGQVVRFYDDVDPAAHASEVLKDIAALGPVKP